MKNITKSRLNVLHNAGTMLKTFDSFSGLSDKEIKEHHLIGELLIKHDREILNLLINLLNEEIRESKKACSHPKHHAFEIDYLGYCSFCGERKDKQALERT